MEHRAQSARVKGGQQSAKKGKEGRKEEVAANSSSHLSSMMALVTSLWEKLEIKYIQKDVTNKKFLVSKFNNFKMTDGRLAVD